MDNKISLLDVRQNTAKCPNCGNKIFLKYPSSIRCTFCLNDYELDDVTAFYIESSFYKHKVNNFDSKVNK